MSHTPGPWKLTGGGGVSACMESETLKSGRRVARRVACAKGTSIPEVEANALLIAAAPDLLAALQSARSQLEEYERERTGETYNSLQINAAIAKATGEQP